MSHKQYSTKSIIYDNGKPVGQVINGVYVRNLKTSHILQKPLAIAFSLVSLESAASLGLRSFCVTNIDTGAIYEISLEDFEANKFAVDRGFGRQYAVRLEKFVKTFDQNSKVLRTGEKKFTPAKKARTRNEPSIAHMSPRQMDLFR